MAASLCLATLLTAELLLWLAPPRGAADALRVRSSSPGELLISPHPYLAYSLTPHFARPGLHHNALGYRGRELAAKKAPGVLRVLCVGGSDTYGMTSSSDEMTWPALLQSYLDEAMKGRVEVINAGVPGYTTFETLAALSFRDLALSPDIVISYQGFNDLRAGTWPDVKPDNTHFRKTWQGMDSPLSGLLELSRVFLLSRWYFTDYAQRATALSSYVTVPDDGAELVHRNGSMSPLGIANFQRNLRSLVAVSGAHGARTLLVAQVYGEATIPPEIAEVVDATMAGFADAAQEIARDPSHAGSVAWLDARIMLPDMPGLFEDGVHLTDIGADRLAWLVAKRLLELTWLSPSIVTRPAPSPGEPIEGPLSVYDEHNSR